MVLESISAPNHKMLWAYASKARDAQKMEISTDSVSLDRRQSYASPTKDLYVHETFDGFPFRERLRMFGAQMLGGEVVHVSVACLNAL